MSSQNCYFMFSWQTLLEIRKVNIVYIYFICKVCPVDVCTSCATIEQVQRYTEAANTMPFEWDEAKNESNIYQHGVDFADIPAVFNGPVLTDWDDRFDYGEDRWISIGLLGMITVVVVWTDRPHDTIRIISARKANRNERQRYETYLANRLGSLE